MRKLSLKRNAGKVRMLRLGDMADDKTDKDGEKNDES